MNVFGHGRLRLYVLSLLEERPRRALRALWRERWSWLAYVPPLALYLWNYFANYAGTRGHSPSLDLLGDYLWLNWYKGVTPALAGVNSNVSGFRTYSGFFIAVMILLLAVIFVLTIRR